MGKLALTIAGDVIGGLLALPTGGISVGVGMAIGGLIGGIAGSLIFPGGQNVVGPRVTDLNISSSAEGSPIPYGSGTFRTAAQFIWAKTIQEHAHVKKLSSTGPTQTTYSYTCSFAMAFARGPGNILTIWLDSKPVYDITGTAAVAHGDAFIPSMYKGTATQRVDPLISSFEGADNTPAFRGLIYAVFEDMPLEHFGNRVPNARGTISCGQPAPLYSMQTTLWDEPPTGGGPLGFVLDRLNRVAYFQDFRTQWLRKFNISTRTWDGDWLRVNPTRSPDYVYDPDVDGSTIFPWVGNAGGGTVVLGVVDRDGYIWSGCNSLFEGIAMFKLDPHSFAAVAVAPTGSTIPGGGLPLDLGVQFSPDGDSYIIGFFPGYDSYMGTIRASDCVFVGMYKFALPAEAPITAPSLAWNQYYPIIDEENSICYFIAHNGTYDAYDWYIFKINMAGGVAGINGLGYNDVQVYSFEGDATTGKGIACIYDEQRNHLVVYTDLGVFQVVDCETGAILDTYGTATDPLFLPSGMYSPVGCVRASDGHVRNGVVFAQTPAGSDDVDPQALLAFQVADFSPHNTYHLPENWYTQGTYNYYNAQMGDWKFIPEDNSALWVSPNNFPGADPTFAVQRFFLDRQSKEGFGIGGYVTSLMEQAGIPSTNIDMSAVDTLACKGYVCTAPQDVKTIVAPLAQFGFFDIIESDFKLRAVVRGGDTVGTIPEEDLGLIDDHKKITETLSTEDSVPCVSTVTFLDPALDFQPGSQIKIRHSLTTGSNNQLMISSPLVMSSTQAIQMAEKFLWLPEIERSSYAFNLWKAVHILKNPTDVFDFNYKGRTMRARVLSSTVGKNYAIQMNSVSESVHTYQATSTGVDQTTFLPGVISVFGPTILYIFDMPLLQDINSTTTGSSGYYFACSSPVEAWPGAILFASADNSSWSDIAFQNISMAYGSCTNALGAPISPWLWDRVNTLTVYMASGATPSSVSEMAVYDEANAIIVGGECLQFKDAVQNANGSWTLSNLLRGRRGTETMCNTHVIGELAFFPLINGGLHRQVVSTQMIGLKRYIKAVTVGASQDSQSGRALTLQGNDLKPYAPCHLKGTKDLSGNFTLSWIRRSRLGAEVSWQDGVEEIPVSEDGGEKYDLEILSADGLTVLRTVTDLTPDTMPYVYTAANSTLDYGTLPDSIVMRVFQKSAQVGRGFAATAVAVGAGLPPVSGSSDASSIGGIPVNMAGIAEGDMLIYTGGQIVPTDTIDLGEEP